MAKSRLHYMGKGSNRWIPSASFASESAAISAAKQRVKSSSVDRVKVTDENGGAVFME